MRGTFWGVSALFRLSKKGAFYSFLPSNTPLILSPFLCLVEILSMLIQPLTLSLRLLVNIRAGHLILTLVCKLPSLGFILCGSLLGLLEILVRVVQSFVFFILLTVYIEERK
jgi:F-type H+-transporting ATPase subunit a